MNWDSYLCRVRFALLRSRILGSFLHISSKKYSEESVEEHDILLIIFFVGNSLTPCSLPLILMCSLPLLPFSWVRCHVEVWEPVDNVSWLKRRGWKEERRLWSIIEFEWYNEIKNCCLALLRELWLAFSKIKKGKKKFEIMSDYFVEPGGLPATSGGYEEERVAGHEVNWTRSSSFYFATGA